MSRLPALLAAALASLAAACAQPEGAVHCSGAKCDDADQRAEAHLCAAIRGNGQLITAHFASLARITEHYGLIDAAAGGSSASITIFMTESVRKNPAVWSCGGEPCDARQRAGRAALLLKSFPGYLAHLATTDEAAAFMELEPLLAKIETGKIEGLLDQNAAGAADALATILSSEDIRDLINPELVELLRNSPDPAFHVRSILDEIEGFGSFSADTPTILVRPGLVDFKALAEKIGRAASFYAGYGPADQTRMSAWLDACAEPGRGKSWFEVAQLPAGDSTCGAELDAMIGDYRQRFIASEDTIHSRIDDPVGGVMPALISTSVLTGDAVDAFRAARLAYANAEPVSSLDVDFDDVRFGYWGSAADLERVAENRRGFDDLKTAKFYSLGEATWRDVLSVSPAEPGLARAQELPGGEVSAGGWSDLHPVLALENLGCDEVVYVTRTGDESSFAQGVAGLLGMDDADRQALYDLDASSSYARSVADANAVWCTNWDDIAATDLAGITGDAYSAAMITADPFFTDSEDAYPGIADVERRGCTPGAPAGN